MSTDYKEIEMNRNDWEKQVFSSNLSTTARMVALVAGSFGNWTEDRNVWAGTSVISNMAGLTRDTTQDYLDAFVEQGWLKIVGRKGRAAEYELCTPVAEPIGILAKKKRAMNPASLAHLKVGRDKTVADMTGPVADMTGNGLPIRTPEVPGGIGTNLKEPKDMNLKEPKEATVPDGPVDQDTLEVRTDTPTLPNSKTLEPSLNLEDHDASLTTEGRPEPAKSRKRFLNTLERREFNRLMDVYGVDEETALEALRFIQGSGGTRDISEAVQEALEGLGMHVQMAGGW